MNAERDHGIRLAGLGALLALLMCESVALASHPPQMPEVERVLVQPSNSDRIVLATRYGGYYLSDDRGLSFSHVCQQAMGYDDTEAYPGVITPSGKIVASIGFSGVASSQDGCTWSVWAPSGPALVTDVGLVSENTLVLLNGATEGDGFLNQVYLSRDAGSTWEARGEPLAPELTVFSVLALDEGQRLFVTARGPAGAELVRSDDGGQAWTRVAIAADDTAEPRLLAVISAAKEWLVVLVAHQQSSASSRADSVLISDDGGSTWQALYRARRGLAGATVSESGVLWFGGPDDGLWRVRVAPPGEAPERVSEMPTRGLTWASGSLYSIGHETTEGYSVAVSRDEGKSFVPLFSLCDTPVAGARCDAASSVGQTCSAEVGSEIWQPDPALCASRPKPPLPDGGKGGAAARDEGTDVRGTFCAALPGKTTSTAAALFLTAIAVTVVLRRRN